MRRTAYGGTVTTPGGPRREGLVRVLASLSEVARAQADDVLSHVPDTGDTVTGRAVDDFVEQAADALRTLDEVLTQSARRLGVHRP